MQYILDDIHHIVYIVYINIYIYIYFGLPEEMKFMRCINYTLMT